MKAKTPPSAVTSFLMTLHPTVWHKRYTTISCLTRKNSSCINFYTITKPFFHKKYIAKSTTVPDCGHGWKKSTLLPFHFLSNMDKASLPLCCAALWHWMMLSKLHDAIQAASQSLDNCVYFSALLYTHFGKTMSEYSADNIGATAPLSISVGGDGGDETTSHQNTSSPNHQIGREHWWHVPWSWLLSEEQETGNNRNWWRLLKRDSWMRLE